MLRMGARVADGIMMSDVTRPMIGGAVASVREVLRANQRSAPPFRISNALAFHIKEDKETAVREARRELLIRGLLDEWYLSSFMSKQDIAVVKANMPAFFTAYRGKTHRIEGVPEHILETLVANLTFTGKLADLDAKMAELEEFKAAGLTELAFRLHDDPAAAIRIIGERIAPRLREETTA
jgi:alkanesulfonate monooxygenase SsuD/methylene tetrahydromethanopterin reductase-like flavin-dependent oxidoreductase (luciferase family)